MCEILCTHATFAHILCISWWLRFPCPLNLWRPCSAAMTVSEYWHVNWLELNCTLAGEQKRASSSSRQSQKDNPRVWLDRFPFINMSSQPYISLHIVSNVVHYDRAESLHKSAHKSVCCCLSSEQTCPSQTTWINNPKWVNMFRLRLLPNMWGSVKILPSSAKLQHLPVLWQITYFIRS